MNEDECTRSRHLFSLHFYNFWCGTHKKIFLHCEIENSKVYMDQAHSTFKLM